MIVAAEQEAVGSRSSQQDEIAAGVLLPGLFASYQCHPKADLAAAAAAFVSWIFFRKSFSKFSGCPIICGPGSDLNVVIWGLVVDSGPFGFFSWEMPIAKQY